MSNFNLQVYEINSQDEYDNFIDKLNKTTALIFENAYQEYLSMCANEAQRQIFNDWWNGKCLSTHDYEYNYSKEDNYEAHSIILTACSDGFG